MPKVSYISVDGDITTLDVSVGTSVMEGAVSNGVDGIVAECGGNMMCATCHVYVDPAFADRLPTILDFEDAMLDSTLCPRDQRSRLSCQIPMSEELDGLVVHLPEAQV